MICRSVKSSNWKHRWEQLLIAKISAIWCQKRKSELNAFTSKRQVFEMTVSWHIDRWQPVLVNGLQERLTHSLAQSLQVDPFGHAAECADWKAKEEAKRKVGKGAQAYRGEPHRCGGASDRARLRDAVPATADNEQRSELGSKYSTGFVILLRIKYSYTCAKRRNRANWREKHVCQRMVSLPNRY